MARPRTYIDPATKKRRRGGFKPFQAPTNPPPGTYDPGIDAQVRASGRGFGDLQQDYTVGKTRAQDDFLTATGDLTTSRDRSLADLIRQAQSIGRGYDELGNRQTEAINASGGLEGGALAQAMRKRAANQELDLQPNRIAGQRLGEDYRENAGKLALGLDRTYGEQGDQTIALARAGRENTQLGIDATEAKWGQAAGTGYVAPAGPANEHRDPKTGQVFRLVRTPGGQLMRLLPSGQLVRRPRYSLRTR